MRPPVRIWLTPVYYPTGRFGHHFVVTLRSRRFGILRTVSEEEFPKIEDAREWAKASRSRGQAVVEEGL